MWLLPCTAQAAATLQLTVGSDPVVGQSVPVVVSGSADAASDGDALVVYVDSASNCASSIYSEDTRGSSTVLIDQVIAAGPISGRLGEPPTQAR